MEVFLKCTGKNWKDFSKGLISYSQKAVKLALSDHFFSIFAAAAAAAGASSATASAATTAAAAKFKKTGCMEVA